MGSTNSWRRFLRRRAVLIGTTATALVAGLTFMLVTASATVAPSGFEGNDGNILLGNSLIPSALGTKDWATLSPAATNFPDSTSSTDDSFGKGSKEDDPVPTVVTQSVPPKDDFENVFLATEHIGTSDFLYQSSIRAAPNGSANLNIELNKGTGVPVVTSNGVTLTRVAGDKLITFDFAGGSGSANITDLTWSLAGSGQTCADSNSSLPCWANQIVLNSAQAEGAVNDGTAGRTGAMTATENPLTNEPLAASTFQEMSINLTTSGILPSGTCAAFARTTIKSRSSGSTGTFNSALKDLVIANKRISNCGSVTIHKEDDAGTPLQGVSFDLYTNNAPTTGPRGTAAEDPITSPLLTCTTNTSGDCTIPDVPLGNYWAVERASSVPAGHNAAADQAISIATGDQVVALTFVNPRQPGSITIHKTDDLGNPLGGVTFTLYNDNATTGGTRQANDLITNPALSCTTATVTALGPPSTTLGDCTISSVPLGRYWVVEGTPPANYAAAPDYNVNVTVAGANVPITMVNPRLHRTIVIVCHQGTNTLRSSAMTLNGSTQNTLGSVPSVLDGKGVTEADLCSTSTGQLASAGAVFSGLGHSTYPGSLTIPGH